MRVAIFSDVHGNLTALDAVLADIDDKAPDLIMFAGDLCVFGARPVECVARLRERDEITCVYGNTDEWIGDQPLLADDIDEEERRRRQHIHDAASWTWAQLGEMDRAWLRELPFHRRVSPTINPQDDLFVVHANPVDVNQPIYPTADVQEERLGEVRQHQSDDDLHPLFKDIITGVVAFGHVHMPNVRRWQSLTLANISYVSLPQDGHDSRAKYGLLTWNGRGWEVTHQAVEYDVEKEKSLLAEIQPPNWQSWANWLEGNWD